MLVLTWGAIISFVIIMYVLLDGFDLGIGILFPFIQNSKERDIMMSTVTPLWDGNETWLVMGGASLYAAFPIAYSTLLPTLYLPIMIMLAALIFRGIAFEFRFKAHKHQILWDISFAGGSTLAAFMQGLILGTFVKGYGDTLPVGLPAYHWFTPFSVMTGIAVVAGYALLGSTWLIVKTVGPLQQKMYKTATILLITVSFFLLLVSLWTPFISHKVMERWFSYPNIIYLAPLPLTAGLVILLNLYCLYKKFELAPFLLSIALFILSYIGFCISSWPYIIPHSITVWQAASPDSSLRFILIGTLILLPILLGYTAYAYWVFSGKVTKAEHY